jgi:uncharacterized integral membrane protein (TIGR00697 family)
MAISKNIVFQSLTQKNQYKYPYILLGFYITFLLSTVCMASKLTLLGSMLLPGGIFVFGFTFIICEIVGEVYGYAYPRLFIWIGGITELFFALIVTSISHLHSPDNFQYSDAYQIVFDPTIRYVVSGLIGLIIGEFVNIYVLAKWKIHWRGKLFPVRSFISAALGQASLTVIVDILNYTGKMSHADLIWMMISGYLWKILFSAILTFPAWLIVKNLKKSENIDYFDINTNFNPFTLSLENARNEKLF